MPLSAPNRAALLTLAPARRAMDRRDLDGAGFAAGSAFGDCEDYALEKRALLLAAGWPEEAVLLAVARLPEGELHTILIVQTDRGDLVLDNLHAAPQRLASLGYDWVSRQAGADLTQWARVRVALVSPS